MAKHTGRKRTKLIKGRVNEALAMGTLATNSLVKGDFDETVDEEAFALSIEATWSLTGLTAGEGPIVFGVSHSDYTAAEIEAVIENTGSWSRGDLVAQEIARRKIRVIGEFDGLSTEERINDGVPIKTKLMWNLVTGATLTQWAYNKSGGTLATGGVILAEGHVWLRPR